MICPEQESLEAVNRVRAAFGGQPISDWLLAVPGDPRACMIALPIREVCADARVIASAIIVPRPQARTMAKALGVRLYWHRLIRSSVRVPLPLYLTKTICEFDEKRLSDLIDQAAFQLFLLEEASA